MDRTFLDFAGLRAVFVLALMVVELSFELNKEVKTGFPVKPVNLFAEHSAVESGFCHRPQNFATTFLCRVPVSISIHVWICRGHRETAAGEPASGTGAFAEIS